MKELLMSSFLHQNFPRMKLCYCCLAYHCLGKMLPVRLIVCPSIKVSILEVVVLWRDCINIPTYQVFAFLVKVYIDENFSKSVDFFFRLNEFQRSISKFNEILFTPRLYKICECQHPRISFIFAKWQKLFNS